MNVTNELTALALTATLLSAGTAVAAPAPASAPAVQAAAAEAVAKVLTVSESTSWSTLAAGYTPAAGDTVRLEFAKAGLTLNIDADFTVDTLVFAVADGVDAKTANIKLTGKTLGASTLIARAKVMGSCAQILGRATALKMTKNGLFEVNFSGVGSRVMPKMTGILDDGSVAPGYAEGGLFRVVGGDPYIDFKTTLESATLEVTKGILRTNKPTFINAKVAITDGSKWTDAWKGLTGDHWLAGDVEFYVAAGKAACAASSDNRWFKKASGAARANLIKTGGGTVRVAPHNGVTVDVREGVWKLDSEAGSGVTVTVRKGAVLRKDASPYTQSLVLEDGAKISASGGPLDIRGKLTVLPKADGTPGHLVFADALTAVPASGYAEMLKTPTEGLIFDLPAKWRQEYVNGVYRAVTDVSDAVIDLASPDAAALPDTCGALTVKLGGKTLTVDKPVSVRDLIVEQGGSVVCTGAGSLTVTGKVVARASVTLPASAVATADIEIARNAVVTVNSAAEMSVRGVVKALPGEGAPGTLRKEGTGKLNLCGRNEHTVMFDGAVMEIADGNLHTSGSVSFMNGGIRILKAMTWTNQDGKWIVSLPGSETEIYVDDGIAAYCGGWHVGKFRKTGPGSYHFAPLGGKTPASELTVAEGTWMVHGDNGGAAVKATLLGGAVIAGNTNGNSKFSGTLTLNAGAVVSAADSALDLASATVVGPESGSLKYVLPKDADPAAAPVALLKTANAGLTFDAPAGQKVIYGNGTYTVTAAATDVTETLSGDTEKALPETIGALTLNLNGHTLTLTNAVQAESLNIVGPGALAYRDAGALKVLGTAVCAGKVSLPAAMLDGSAFAGLEIARDGVVTVDSDADMKVNLYLSTPDGAGAPGKLRKEGTGTLTLQGIGGANTIVKNACIEIADGGLHTQGGIGFDGAVLRLLKFAPDKNWTNAAGYWVCSLNSETEIYVAEGLRSACGAWYSGKFRKTGPGTCDLALRDNTSALTVAEGVWRVYNGGSEGAPAVTVKAGATLKGTDGSETPFAGPITWEDGARMDCSERRPCLSGVQTAQGKIYVTKGEHAQGVALWMPKNFDPELAKHMIVTDAGFIVTTGNGTFAWTPLTVPEGTEVGSAIDLALKEAAAANGKTQAVLELGTNGGQPLSAGDAEKALSVFENISTAETAGDTATVHIGYDFGITDAEADGENLHVSVAVKQNDGTPAKLAPGTKLQLMAGDTCLGEVTGDGSTGEARFTVPLSKLASGSQFTVKAVNAK